MAQILAYPFVEFQPMPWQPPPFDPTHPGYLAFVDLCDRETTADRRRLDLCTHCGYPVWLGRCTETICKYQGSLTARERSR